MTQIVNEKRDKIKFTCDLAPILLRRLKMDPSWPYVSSSALYMPLRAMTPDTRNYFGQQEVTLSQPAFGPYQFSHGRLYRFAILACMQVKSNTSPTKAKAASRGSMTF